MLPPFWTAWPLRQSSVSSGYFLKARDTRIPGSSSCLQERWGQGGIPQLSCLGISPQPRAWGRLTPSLVLWH